MIDKLLEIMTQLRDPDGGCPWDLKQNYQSIVPHTLEEAYEVAYTIEQQDYDALKGELGDLLFQVIFYSQLAKEEGHFEFNDVVGAICEKLIRRHPHVFAQQQFDNEAQIKGNWEAEKAKEREQKGETSLLDDVPHNLPALSRANKLQKRCATVGFEWPDVKGALAKVKEEIDEVEQELDAPNVNPQAVGEELGDLFFALVNVSRYLKQDPETLLRQANQKFEARFREVERRTITQGRTLAESSLEQMDGLWNEVKQSEKRKV